MLSALITNENIILLWPNIKTEEIMLDLSNFKNFLSFDMWP